MDQLSEFFEPIIDFVLANLGIVIFAVFVLSGLLGRGDKSKDPQKEAQQESQRQQRPRSQGEVDNRPLSERLAEAFGVEVPEQQSQPGQRSGESAQPASMWREPRRQESEGRRSTTFGNVQDNYPDLFGGPSILDEEKRFEETTRWGFDETEWGTTFDKNEEQWGKAFPDRKSDEPYVHWPS